MPPWEGTPVGLPRVISVTDLDNARSIALMQRLGMSFVECTEIVDDGTTSTASCTP